ncbi:phosphoglycerate dehydrogenase [Telmatospirillum sp. J64-1]|uniref:phosphoglycerate dehydrogenase n=1 Tax=Telmatospirillum sp. J64-1 TaxID=2502183 RepID=UPI00115D5157|nr:phosphoglycerate dehydrogenase [Telmatospirillum sp. J64-1]
MGIVVVTTSPGFGTVGRVPGKISERGWEFIRCIDTSRPDGGVAEYRERMDFLVVGLIPATAEMIASAPRLKGILKHGVGVDNIDIAAATARRIPVLNAPGTNANAVAELAIGSMFSLARRIPMLHRVVTDGGWQRHVGSEIEGKVLGVVGLGNIGKTLARKGRALGMRVLASDPYPDVDFAKEHGVEIVELRDVLAQSDFVSLHVFGGKDNAHLIGAEEIALMKKTAYLMNFARGEVVDTEALYDALANDRLMGAAIDAYVQEPPDRAHPIFSHPRVVFTPHSGADTTEAVERMGLMNIADIEAILDGQRPARVLNPEIYR